MAVQYVTEEFRNALGNLSSEGEARNETRLLGYVTQTVTISLHIGGANVYSIWGQQMN